MSNTNSDVSSLNKQIHELQSLLGEVLPELVAYYDRKKVETDRSAIHQGKARELRELINRVARCVGKPPIES